MPRSTAPARDSTTPGRLAQRYGVSIHKILGWIRNGELQALNVASDHSRRKQWAILPEHLEAFEARCAAVPKHATTRRPRKDKSVYEYF